MNTLENFNIPGIESFQTIAEQLPKSPRTLHAVGIRASVVFRFLLCILSFIAGAYIVFFTFNSYIKTASFFAWFILVVSVPFFLFFIPWLIVSTFKKRMKTFNKYQNIYQNGVPALGYVNTLTRVTGRDLDCHHIEHSWSSSRSIVRIDYTFEVDNVVKTGTMMLKEKNMNVLSINSEICVLYIPDDMTQNMIFPIPGSEFFGR